jgi:hypothetical protein
MYRQMFTCFEQEWNGVTPFLKESAQESSLRDHKYLQL